MRIPNAPFLEKIPSKTKKEIERWYIITSIIALLGTTIIGFLTAKKYYMLWDLQKTYQQHALDNQEISLENISSSTEITPEFAQKSNQKYTDVFDLIIKTIPDDMVCRIKYPLE